MNNILLPAISEVIERSSLERKLSSGKKLRIKLGVDPSAPDLHLGHYIVLNQLCQFQKAGHKLIFLIGDYTAKIGDPSGRKSERPMLTDEQIKKNVATYVDQVSLVLDVKKVEIRYNSQWYEKMNLGSWLNIIQNFSVNQIFERDDFTKRIKGGLPLGMHETAYPVMQAYDSVELKADVELGGTDQKFNMLAGRALQRKMNLPVQDVITIQLLVGTDGKKKMSKSVGNYIGLTAAPEDMFGKVMSIPDEAVESYARLVLGKSIGDIKEIAGDHPKNIKEELAEEIVHLFHKGSGASARAHFERVFSERKSPDKGLCLRVKAKNRNYKEIIIEDVRIKSMSELRRRVDQGGVSVNNKKVTWENLLEKPRQNDIIRFGKIDFISVDVD